MLLLVLMPPAAKANQSSNFVFGSLEKQHDAHGCPQEQEKHDNACPTSPSLSGVTTGEDAANRHQQPPALPTPHSDQMERSVLRDAAASERMMSGEEGDVWKKMRQESSKEHVVAKRVYRREALPVVTSPQALRAADVAQTARMRKGAGAVLKQPPRRVSLGKLVVLRHF
ncbi:hypothetical protein cyc_08518 [Cyclospora cayetanensis]|uniref:Uncharacterized protein n=1 Tax=Cyclospora cayetanensis TaxID=88456 RepID=A0A1D3D5S8_9EIME|nr:hypothetical protein cyc_08518 [Cyclospora cayetanensis]